MQWFVEENGGRTDGTVTKVALSHAKRCANELHSCSSYNVQIDEMDAYLDSDGDLVEEERVAILSHSPCAPDNWERMPV